MRILLIGCGSIGSRHLSILRELRAGEIIVCDLNEGKLAELMKRFCIEKGYTDYREALKNRVDAVFICTPPDSHLLIARHVLEKGFPMFIEKPLSCSLEGVEEFVKEVEEQNIIVAVGYMMRFHPAILKMKEILEKNIIGRVYSVSFYGGQYLPDWHPGSDYRKEYSAQRKLGGGIILDATHELDYSIWLFGKPEKVFCHYEKISNLEIDTEDIFSLIAKTETGVIVEVHGDYLQRSYQRRCQVLGEKGSILWDYNMRATMVYVAEEKKWEVFPFDIDWNSVYRRELEHFLWCVKEKRKPLVNEKDGLLALKFVQAAKKSGIEKKMIHFCEL